MTGVRHVVCVLALMWTGLVNGQPFFFSTDSTNYIRAADVALHLASGKRISTAWTERYSSSLSAAPAKVKTSSANDLSSGLIMSGRSPYIGGLIYLGYLVSDFWAFVVLQALTAYCLIVLVLRQLGVTSSRAILAVVGLLAATTALPTYNSLLMADAFSAFGILAFALLAGPGRFSTQEKVFLNGVLLVFVVSHLTHIWMLIGMLLALLAFRIDVPKRAWVSGVAMIIAGILSVQVTSLVVRQAFGKEPQLLPLLSARFIADGPGKAFIDAGCDNRRFQICRIPIGEPRSDPLILFGTKPSNGAYMLASSEEKRRMGEEDIHFAAAVFRFDPLEQSAMIVRNSIRQLLWIDYDGLNQGCWDKPDCWQTLPEPIRTEMKATPSGANAWPQEVMNLILYATVITSLVAMPFLYRRIGQECSFIRTWIVVILAAMLVSSVLGGAVAEPQYRYQGRLIWLVPFLAACMAAMINLPRLALPKRTFRASQPLKVQTPP